MPHIIVKLHAGKSAQQKQKLTDKIVKDRIIRPGERGTGYSCKAEVVMEIYY